MRFLTARSLAYAIFAGAALVGSAPAFAQNVDAGNPYYDHAEGTMGTSAGVSTPASGGSYLATHGHYLQMDPRDAKAVDNAQSADAGNPYYDHAEGTMSTNAGTAAPAPARQSGEYVASYHQYMQMDPRDAKADPNAAADVDGSNVYFNHAKGTMSGN